MRVLISGAGIAGPSLAWCLERLGHQPVVVERAPQLRDEGYMMDFFGSGYDAAERLDLLPDLASIHYPIDRFVFVNGRGRERLSLAYPVLRRRLFNDRHFNFMRGDLERVLYERFQGRDVSASA
jgi:2-polyprenyl-6-methoxyphenol hydroxylase-like FAD-dependent oxidoreductase